VRYLTLFFLISAACKLTSVEQAQLRADAEICKNAVDHGWTASSLESPQETCQNKMRELRNLVMRKDILGEIRPCMHGGAPRFCWTEQDGALRIWWSIHTDYRVPISDRGSVEPYIVWP